MSHRNKKRREWRLWLESVCDQMLDVDEEHAFSAFEIGLGPSDYVLHHGIRLRSRCDQCSRDPCACQE